MKTALSQESIGTVASGYQEEGYGEMLKVGEMGAMASSSRTDLTSILEEPPSQIVGEERIEVEMGEGGRKKEEMKLKPREQREREDR